MAVEAGTNIPQPQAGAASEEESYLLHDTSIGSWLFTLDHKRIGIMYLFSVLLMFAVGGFFAVLIRTALLTPGKTHG
jgi:cytochrome c oxidase subunit 1